MTRTDTKNWAKVIIISNMDARLKEIFSNPNPITAAPNLEEQQALLRQRNRVVRFLAYGNPKTLGDFNAL